MSLGFKCLISIENGRFETDLFVKPSNAQLFLDYKSNHPEHCKKSIIYSQSLRAVERCSKVENLSSHLEDLKKKFLTRNYPQNLVDSQVERALTRDRKTLIQQNRKRKDRGRKKLGLFLHKMRATHQSIGGSEMLGKRSLEMRNL